MSPDDARRRRVGLANSAKERLVAGLDQVLGERFTRKGRERVDFYSDGIVVSSFTLFDRPEEDGSEREPFVESAFKARRRIGLMVMRRLAAELDVSDGAMGGVTAAAVESVMESPDGWPPNLRDWVEELEHSGRAAVVAATITWCEGALRLVGASSRVKWTDPQYSSPSDLPGRLVRLQANVDAVMGSPGSGERLFVVGEALPSPRDRISSGFVALVRAVASGAAPERVTIGAPSRGSMERFEVTGDLLDLAVDQVIETVARIAGSNSIQ